ncbi:AraC family transcriptional regulator, partial [Flavobacterium sp. 3-210]
TQKAVAKTLLPNFQTIFVFSFGKPVYFKANQGDEIEVGRYLFLGPVKQALPYRLEPGSEILVINFKDDAFYRFFGKVILS